MSVGQTLVHSQKEAEFTKVHEAQGEGARECKQAHIRRTSEHTDIYVCKLQMVGEQTGMYVGQSGVII